MRSTAMIARILTIAGSDSSGGAGIQADLKTITALGGYGATAITAITAQNTEGVRAILALPPALVKDQIEAVLEDIGADAIKIGMLANAGIIHTVAEVLAQHRSIPVILDPVMVATSGAVLLPEEAISALIEDLLPLATLLTPNIAEAQLLSRQSITSEADIQQAAQIILAHGPQAVLVKGGHFDGPEATDYFLTKDGSARMSAPRIDTPNTHGTGCTLSSAIATYHAQGHPLPEAIERAKDYLQGAIRHNPSLGHGPGPLNHMWNFTVE